MSPVKVPTAAKHPLDPPSKEEIIAVTNAVRTHMVEKEGVNAFRFLNGELDSGVVPEDDD